METLICIILCLLGMAAFFLSKYAGRTDKTKEPSFSFWWADNWPELTVSVILVAMAMILLLIGSFQLKVDEWLQDQNLPLIAVVAPKPIVSALIGALGTKWIYSIFKKKVQDKVAETP